MFRYRRFPSQLQPPSRQREPGRRASGNTGQVSAFGRSHSLHAASPQAQIRHMHLTLHMRPRRIRCRPANTRQRTECLRGSHHHIRLPKCQQPLRHRFNLLTHIPAQPLRLLRRRGCSSKNSRVRRPAPSGTDIAASGRASVPVENSKDPPPNIKNSGCAPHPTPASGAPRNR